MKFTNIMFAMFIFTGILLGIGGFYNDLTTTYGTGNTTNASAPAFLTYNELNTSTNNMYSEMNSTEGGLGGASSSTSPLWTVFGLILKAPVYIAKAFMSTGGNIIAAVNTFSTTVGVPGWVSGLIITAIVFAIVVAVIRMVTNKEM